MFEFIDPFVFLIALGIGIFLTYVFKEPTRFIYKHPMPDNVGEKTTYKNDVGTCYRYKMTDVPCQAVNEEIPI